jgi:hypothetical protein
MNKKYSAGVIALFIALSCASCSTNKKESVQTKQAIIKGQQLSAELTIYNSNYEKILTDSRILFEGKKIRSEDFEVIRISGQKMYNALIAAHNQLNLYLVTFTYTDELDKAFKDLESANANLNLVSEKVLKNETKR